MSNEFSQAYRRLLERLLFMDGDAHTELNARTGVKVSVLDPTSFTLDLSDGLLPVPGNRKVYPKTAAAEVAWFLQGDRRVDFIRKYAPIWDKFVEEERPLIMAAADGEVYGDPVQVVTGAYGYRWRKHFGRDQVQDALTALLKDRSDRRVFISAWDPAEDGLGRPSKNVPCPVGFTLSITAGRLNSTLLIRSSDVFVGLPYDVMGHAFLMKAFQHSYNYAVEARNAVALGTMQVSLAHPHMYEKHWDMAAESLLEEPVVGHLHLPGWGIHRISNFPDAFVEHVAMQAKGLEQPEFGCRPEVVQ